MTNVNKKIKSIKPVMGGGVFLAFDFAALEVRAFTNIAREHELGKILSSGLDMHSSIAKKVFPKELGDVPLEKIKSEYKQLRSYSKSATFSVLYGSSEYNLSEQIGIPVEQARDIIEGLLAGFPGLRDYMKNCHIEAISTGIKDTYFGYRRQLDEVITKFTKYDKDGNIDEEACKNAAKQAGYGLRYKHALNASQNHEVQCLRGDTKIKCLNGEIKEIKDLVGQTPWIYAYDVNSETIVPAQASKVFKSGEVTKTLRITLDNNEIIECTPEHLFMKRNGEYIEAQSLKIGQSLMPLYYKTNKGGYEDLINPHISYDGPRTLSTRISTHQLVSRYFNGKTPKGYQIHHIDKSTTNNEPSNLEVLSLYDHALRHSQERSLKFMEINKNRKLGKYPNWDNNQKISAKNIAYKKLQQYNTPWSETKEQNSDKWKYINKTIIWNDNNPKLDYMKQNIINVGKNTSYYKLKKHYKKIIEQYNNSNILLDNDFKQIWEKYRLSCGIRLSSLPHFNTSLHDLLVQELCYNHKVKNIEVVNYDTPIEVFDIEVPEFHNFGLASGIFIHNSTASIVGWIVASHIQDEFIKQGMKSRVIGNVHDSVETDIYPGELPDAMRICNYHAKVIPNMIYDWMDLVPLDFDFELGTAWLGCECPKVTFNDDDTTTIVWQGGNLHWDWLKEQLDLGYDIEVLSYEEKKDIPHDDKSPLPQPTKEVKVEFKINTKATIKEFKSKYYVGNGKIILNYQ